MKEFQKEIVYLLLKKRILVNQDILMKLKKVQSLHKLQIIKDKIKQCQSQQDVVNIIEEKERVYSSLSKRTIEPSVEIVFSYKEKPYRKKEVKDFVHYFRRRYQTLSNILKNRLEFQRTLSISKILEKKESEEVVLIGLVQDVGESKSGHIMLTLEDLTGTIKVLINKNNEIFKEGKDLVHDEVIGIIGTNKENIVFANKFFYPDAPQRELKKSPDDAHVAFISDFHVGSKDFLPDKMEDLLTWLNSDNPIVQKIHYVIIAGDLVDGIGIYPGQKDDLVIDDIYKQYEKATEYIARIPKRMKIVICPGNHDGMRLAEPQPVFSEKLAPELNKMENVTLVTNPGHVKIHKSLTFPGFDVLLYHGYSFDYYASNIDSIRAEGGYHRSDLIMKFLLKRRHLAPVYGSTLYVHDTEMDPLVISTIPDFFITGHIHYSKVANYNNTTTICGSCWQGPTEFQEKLGHDPEPGRVPVVNLQTREVKVYEF